MRKAGRAVFLGIAAALAFGAPANASTVTIGTTADPSILGPGGCGGCRVLQIATDPSSPSYVVPPGNWVVTSWSTAAGEDLPQLIRLLLFEHAGGTTYTLRAEDMQNGTQTEAVNTFDVQIPVEPGWLLGFDTGVNGHTSNPFAESADVMGGHYGTLGTPADLDATFPYSLVNVSVVLESDLDDDSAPDSADNCPSAANADQLDSDSDGLGNACDPTPFGPVQGPPPDVDPPETTITKEPPDKGERNKVRIEFVADETGASFECKVDRKPFKPCTSPTTFRVRNGRHRFLVRATDAAGNVDPTADRDKFKVVD